MRKPLMAGNWKMNTLPAEGAELAKTICEHVKTLSQEEKYKIILGVPFTHIDRVVNAIDLKFVKVSAQDCAMYDSGAYTGEVSAKMIKSINCEYAIIGHSERRQYFGDTDEVIAKNLQVVDMTASILARDNKMPMWVFGLNEKDSIVNTMNGKFCGTKVTV